MNLDPEEKIIQLMTLENFSLKRFGKLFGYYLGMQKKYTPFLINKMYVYVFPILYFLY